MRQKIKRSFTDFSIPPIFKLLSFKCNSLVEKQMGIKSFGKFRHCEVTHGEDLNMEVMIE